MLDFAFSPCPNDTFALDAFVHGKISSPLSVTPYFYDIEELNRLALLGRYHITKISAFAYGLVDHEYELLHSGAALGHGMGPKVVAKQPLDLKGKRVAIPGRMTTAAFLFQLFYPGNELVEMPYNMIIEAVNSGKVDAGVIIHETRFTHNLHELIDLGAFYQAAFNTALPLGLIVAKKSLGKAVLAQIEQAIHDSIVFGEAHPESSHEFVLKHATEKNLTVIKQHIALYVNHETKKLSSAGLHAIQTMHSLCHTPRS